MGYWVYHEGPFYGGGGSSGCGGGDEGCGCGCLMFVIVFAAIFMHNGSFSDALKCGFIAAIVGSILGSLS